MLRYIIFCFLIFKTTTCASQNNLIQRIYQSRTTIDRFTYTDSTGKMYDNLGLYNGVKLELFFKSAEWDSKKKYLLLEGFAGEIMLTGDTIRNCCGYFFIAQPKNGFLTNIRRLGQTHDNNLGDKSKSVGYFRFTIKLQLDDRLYFCAADGVALQEFKIADIFYK